MGDRCINKNIISPTSGMNLIIVESKCKMGFLCRYRTNSCTQITME